MVVRVLFMFLAVLSAGLYSQEFTATVSRNEVRLGEGFMLNLTLKNSEARSAPSLHALKDNFMISSQHQMANTMIKDGHITSSLTWKIGLVPRVQGEIIIPALSINAGDDTLLSEPIKMTVLPKDAPSTGSEVQGLSLALEVSEPKPYKNESIFLTVRLTSAADVANVRMEKFTLEEAMVELNGEPVVTRKVVGGVKVDIIEFNYIVTPLKAGILSIPALVVHGGTPAKRTPPRGTSFFSLHDFDRLVPFALQTEARTLDVQPPVAEVQPWLPAKDLQVEEVWDEAQTFQVGEPIMRGFKIMAEGTMSSLLPSLSGSHPPLSESKVYADKPEMADSFKRGHIHSFRKEQYTLLPQQPGELTLPEVAISWWDVVNKKKNIARIPARVVQVLPAAHVQQADEPIAPLADAVPAAQMPADGGLVVYGVLAVLGLLLAGAGAWVLALQKKIARLTHMPLQEKSVKRVETAAASRRQSKPAPAKDKKEKLPDLNPT